jgi:CheY-like chemotaxis protein
MDGAEVASRIGSDPRTAATPVVLLATRRSLEAATTGRRGVASAVAKPVRQVELHEALVRVLAAPVEVPTPAGGVGHRLASQGSTPGDPVTGGDRGRILVVEDNTTNQMVATGLLVKLGYQPEVVCNGRQAVDAVRRNRYDAVLMDCNMPVMDGYEATLAIRVEEGDGRRVPIIAMTAGAMVGDRDRCLTVGMDDYVAKPVKLADLDRALSRWGAARQSPPASAVIDGEQLQILWSLDGGDGNFLSSLVDSFFTSSAQTLPALAAAVEAGDGVTLAQEAHRLKGEAATLGANGLADLCRELEGMDSPLDKAAAADLVARATTEMDRARTMLQAAVHDARVAH